MNRTTYAVVEFCIQLGQLVGSVNTRVRYVSHRGRIHDVPDDKLLDSLVLGNCLSTVGASHKLDVSTSMLVAPVISTLGGHL